MVFKSLSGKQKQAVATYRQYMASKRWFKRREDWLGEYVDLHGIEPSCAGCGTSWTLSRDDLHHHNYDRLGKESFEDLEPLCRSCHSRVHKLLNFWMRGMDMKRRDSVSRRIVSRLGRLNS